MRIKRVNEAKNKKSEVLLFEDCINFYLEGELARKFAQYHIDNWDNMPCFRGGGLSGANYYHTVFQKEALPYIEKFLEEHSQEIKRNN